MEEQLQRGRNFINRLEVIQYEYFNGRPIWTDIQLNDLKLFMAYIYFGNPTNENNETPFDDNNNDIFNYYNDNEKKLILNMIDIIQNNIIKIPISNIDVGYTYTHSICEMKCDICHNFPGQDVHLWKLLRIKLNPTKVVYIDFQNGRTYKNWKDYIDNNTLPKGFMFFPETGYYEEETYLIQNKTPQSNDKILNNIDLLGNAATFSSGIMLAGGLIFPIMAPVLIPAAITIGACSLWDMTREVSNLVDIKKHNQPLFGEHSVKHWFNLSLAALGLITAPMSVTIRQLEISNSAFSASKIGKSLTIAHKGVCITQCTIGILSLIENIKMKNTFKGLMTLRLDLFIVVGELLPIFVIQNIADFIITSVGTSQIISIISKFPNFVYQNIIKVACFVQMYLVHFMDKVFKYLQKELTLDKCLCAWKNIREFVHYYNTHLLPSLNGTKLLKHIVNDLDVVQQALPNGSFEEIHEVKLVLCGEDMVNLMFSLNASTDRVALRFYIEKVLEKAIAIRLMYDESSMLCIDRGMNNSNKFRAEFCKQFNLKACQMDEYVLHSIRKADVNDYTNAYRLYRLQPENYFAEQLVCNSSNGNQSVDSYTVPAPCSDLNKDSCLQFTRTLDSQNNEHTNYRYTELRRDESILFSVSAFSIKIIFFHVETIDGSPSLSITFYRDSSGSANITFPGLLAN